jgi:hypothetical protein
MTMRLQTDSTVTTSTPLEIILEFDGKPTATLGTIPFEPEAYTQNGIINEQTTVNTPTPIVTQPAGNGIRFFVDVASHQNVGPNQQIDVDINFDNNPGTGFALVDFLITLPPGLNWGEFGTYTPAPPNPPNMATWPFRTYSTTWEGLELAGPPSVAAMNNAKARTAPLRFPFLNGGTSPWNWTEPTGRVMTMRLQTDSTVTTSTQLEIQLQFDGKPTATLGTVPFEPEAWTQNGIINRQESTGVQHTLTRSANAGGTVTGTESGNYDAGTTVNLTAVPNAGFRFSNWTGTGLASLPSTNNPLSFPLNANVTVAANFVATQPVTVNINGNISTIGSFAPGDTVTIPAQTRNGWRFTGWGGTAVTWVTGGGANAWGTFLMPASGSVTLTTTWEEIQGAFIELRLGAGVPGAGLTGRDLLPGDAFSMELWLVGASNLGAIQELDFTMDTTRLHWNTTTPWSTAGAIPGLDFFAPANPTQSTPTVKFSWAIPDPGTPAVNTPAGTGSLLLTLNFVVQPFHPAIAGFAEFGLDLHVLFDINADVIPSSTENNFVNIVARFNVTREAVYDAFGTPITGAALVTEHNPLSEVTITAGTRTDGYEFSTWEVVSGGPLTWANSTSATSNVADFIMPANDVTVRAVWIRSGTVTIINDPVDPASPVTGATVNGGTVTVDVPVESGSLVTIYAGSRPGYAFIGWTLTTPAEGDAGVRPVLTSTLAANRFSVLGRRSTFEMPGNAVAFTAQWKRIVPGDSDNSFERLPALRPVGASDVTQLRRWLAAGVGNRAPFEDANNPNFCIYNSRAIRMVDTPSAACITDLRTYIAAGNSNPMGGANWTAGWADAW